MHGALFRGLIDTWANASFCQMHQGVAAHDTLLILDAVQLLAQPDFRLSYRNGTADN